MDTFKEVNDWVKWLEKPVCVKEKFIGTLKYFGTTKFSDGLWCGVELDMPVGKNNGTVNNVKYFTCLPKFGIFVPVSKVQKIENSPKTLNIPLMHCNRQVNPVQNFHEKTIIISKTDLPDNSNKENEEFKESEITKNRSDSDSLGIIDMNLIEALSWELDINVDFKDSNFKLDNHETDFSDDLPVSSCLLSSEISNPKYASTPRHPIKRRVTEFFGVNNNGLALQNINENDVFFDDEKLKNNPYLTSTCEYNASKCASVNISSPIQSNFSSPPIDLNETKVISPSFSNIFKVDLNKTQIISEESEILLDNDLLSKTFKMPTKIDSFETKNLNSTVCLQFDKVSNGCQNDSPVDTVFEADYIESKNLNSTVSLKCDTDTMSKTSFTDTKDLNLTINLGIEREPEVKRNGQKSHLAGTLADNITCSNIDLLSTHDFGVKFNVPAKEFPNDVHNKSKSELNPSKSANTSFSKPFNINSLSTVMNGRDNSKSPLEKTFVLNPSPEKKFNNEKALSVRVLDHNALESFDYKSKFLEETFIVDKSLSNKNSRLSVCIPTKSCETLNYSKRFSNKILKKDSESKVNSNNTKSKKGRLSSSLNLEEKTSTIVKTRYSRGVSDSEKSELLNTTGSLPLLCKDTESLKGSNKIKSLAPPKVSSANNLNVCGAAKAPLNAVRKSVFNKETISKNSKVLAKNVFGSQLKEPTTSKFHNSRPSLGLPSNVAQRIPRRNSLAANSKKILPVGIKPRYSMLPLVKEENFDQSKKSLHSVRQLAKSNVSAPKSGSMISSSAEFPSSKISKIASSLPQKLVTTRKTGQQLSNAKDSNDACPKIPRYNLRAKK